MSINNLNDPSNYITLRSRTLKKIKRRTRSLEDLNEPRDITSHDLSQFDEYLNKSVVKMSVLNVDVALKIIPEFDGSSDRLHKFLLCCDMVYSGLMQTESDKFLNLVKTKLSHKAYDIVKYTDFNKWQDLKAELKAKFQCTKSIEQLQIELINIRQQRNENVTSYASRVEKIVSELNEVCIDSEGATSAKTIINLNSKTALKAFQEGLVDPIKLIIKASRFTTLQEAINKACEEEQTLNTRRSSNSYEQTSTVKCQICKRLGHSAEKCFNRYPDPKYQNYKSSSNTSNFPRPNDTRRFKPEIAVVQNPIICAYCKATGHHITVCRKRQFANSMKNKNHMETSKQDSTSPSGNAIGSVPADTINTPVRIQDIK